MVVVAIEYGPDNVVDLKTFQSISNIIFGLQSNGTLHHGHRSTYTQMQFQPSPLYFSFDTNTLKVVPFSNFTFANYNGFWECLSIRSFCSSHSYLSRFFPTNLQISVSALPGMGLHQTDLPGKLVLPLYPTLCL